MGQLVLNRFRIEARVGGGGFGTVYRAWDGRLERPVAVKVIEGPAGRRALREAHAAARLNHRSIVTLYELGEDGGRAFLVSELVEGSTLRELLGSGGLSDRDVAGAGAELCEAIAHAHDRGVVHRDVKPENVIVRAPEGGRPGPWSRAATGCAMLMDFGVASVAGAERLTRTGEVVGTIAYMAPEQADGADAGPAADLYSLALTLYECWAGRNPVARPTPAETARAIGAPVPPVGEPRPDLPAPLRETIDACLIAEPELRPSPSELREELHRAAPRLDASRPLPPADAARPSRWSSRVALARAAAALVLTAAVAALAWAGRPGGALIVGALGLPGLAVASRPREWGLPLLAPPLGAVGLAPVYVALAGLADRPRRCAALGALGWAWAAVAESVTGASPLNGIVPPAPAGWDLAVGEAAVSVLVPLLRPEALAAAATWALAAAALALLLRARNPALAAVGSLGWAAGLVAAHGVLVAAPSQAESGVLAACLAAVLAAAVWARSRTRLPLRRSAVPAGTEAGA